MDDTNLDQTGIELMFKDENLNIVEAAIPYVDTSLKLPLAIFIKISEIKSMVTGFSDEDTLTACGLTQNNFDLEGMLIAMRKKATSMQATQLDMMLNVINAMKIYNTYNQALDNTLDNELHEASIHPSQSNHRRNNSSNAQQNNEVKRTNPPASQDRLSKLLPLLLASINQDGKSNEMVETLLNLFSNDKKDITNPA